MQKEKLTNLFNKFLNIIFMINLFINKVFFRKLRSKNNKIFLFIHFLICFDKITFIT